MGTIRERVWEIVEVAKPDDLHEQVVRRDDPDPDPS